MATQQASKPRKAGRPRSRKTGFEAVRVATDTRRALRVICADLNLGCIDDVVEALLECWNDSPVQRRQRASGRVLLRKGGGA